jgi:hypothetical protein
MRYFYDTEFIEDGSTIDLISIGVVCEDGREFYAQNFDCLFGRASAWVKENVFPHLVRFRDVPVDCRAPWYYHNEIGLKLKAWIGDDKPEFWAYYADYDHVALCQLFGTMMDLPKGWPMYTRDIKQLCDWVGNPRLNQQGKDEHSALLDARWAFSAFHYLIDTFAGILPMAAGNDDGTLSDVLTCDSVAGGAASTDEMPDHVTLRRVFFEDNKQTHSRTREYFGQRPVKTHKVRTSR